MPDRKPWICPQCGRGLPEWAEACGHGRLAATKPEKYDALIRTPEERREFLRHVEQCVAGERIPDGSAVYFDSSDPTRPPVVRPIVDPHNKGEA